MAYRIALLTAALIIAAGFLVGWLMNRQVQAEIRRVFREKQEGGELSPELQQIDPEKIELQDFNVKLPASQMLRLDLARFLMHSWYLWAPVVTAMCFSCAAVINAIRPRRE